MVDVLPSSVHPGPREQTDPACVWRSQHRFLDDSSPQVKVKYAGDGHVATSVSRRQAQRTPTPRRGTTAGTTGLSACRALRRSGRVVTNASDPIRTGTEKMAAEEATGVSGESPLASHHV